MSHCSECSQTYLLLERNFQLVPPYDIPEAFNRHCRESTPIIPTGKEPLLDAIDSDRFVALVNECDPIGRLRDDEFTLLDIGKQLAETGGMNSTEWFESSNLI